MPSPVEQALISLVPSLDPLPAELVNLANVLLIQSRSKASNLKQDEEIGRVYACAHIACERLRTNLPIDTLRPTPPVQPRVYKKLHAYLDKTLITPSTPRSARHVDALKRTPTSSRATAIPQSRKRNLALVEDTPSRSAADADHSPSKLPHDDADTPSRRTEKRVRTPNAAGKATPVPTPTQLRSGRKGRGATATGAATDLLAAAEPAVQSLCAAFKAPWAAEHLRGGLEAAAAELGGDEGLSAEAVGTLAVALMMYILRRWKGREVLVGEYTEAKERGVNAVRGRRKAEVVLGEVTGFMEGVRTGGLLGGEWFVGVEEGGEGEVGLGEGDVEMGGADGVEERRAKRKVDKTPLRRKEKHAPRPEGDEDEEETGAAGLMPGFGTMFQDEVDWLSDDRREEFAHWKADILKRIQQVEGVTGRGRKGAGRGVSREVASTA